MFKLVLCALFAVAAAEPSGLSFIQPAVSTYSTVLAPATTSISSHGSSVIHPSPLVYSTPLAYTHFIKKRSAPLLSFPYYGPQAYAAGPLLASSYAGVSPVVHSPAFYSHAVPAVPAVHLIKKRSVAALSPLSYAGAFLPQTYATGPVLPLLNTQYINSSPVIASTPLVSHAVAPYAHLIKKRSAPSLLTAYSAPLSYSHQSRLDVQTTHTPVSTISYATPFAYSSPIGLSHIF